MALKKTLLYTFTFIWLLLSASIIFAQTKGDKSDTPGYKGWVNDFEDIFTEKEEKKLTQLLDSFEKETSYEVVIVTLGMSMVGEHDSDMFNVTYKIANAWGVGKKDLNNGVLIGISRGRKKIRIQNGLGTEKVFSDEKTKEIIDTKFIPGFRNGKFFEGTYEGTKAIIDFLHDKQIPSK